MTKALIITLIVVALVAGGIGIVLENFEEPGETRKGSGPGSDTLPSMTGKILIREEGEFKFDPSEIVSLRGDIFVPGAFSLFDILVHLDERGDIEMEYHMNTSMNTHVIESINGKVDWWYQAHYDGGWLEHNVFRMDHYPYRDRMRVDMLQIDPSKLANIYTTFEEEIERLERNNGTVVLPRISIRGPTETVKFYNVTVEAHDLRNDTFVPGTMTAIDVIMSLGDLESITYKLQWYESIGSAGRVKSYWVEAINDDVAEGGCGFVYEAGSEHFNKIGGNHIHIPSDSRVINSPEYSLWFWICL